MLKNVLYLFSFIVVSLSAVAQDNDLLKSSTIPSELRVKSNAVIRYDKTDIEIKAYNKFIYKNKRIVTVFNKGGKRHQGTAESYHKRKKIRVLEAKIYDKDGKEIKKFKEKDFEDESAVSGGTLYSDDRVKYLDYTPNKYPYTILYEVEIEYTSTAFFPSWNPINDFYVSTQSSEYKIINNSETQLKTKAINLDSFNIIKHSDFHYTAENLMSLKPEAYSPSFETFAPSLEVALLDFSYEGYRGKTDNWKNLGKWMYDELLQNRDVVSELTKKTVLELVEGIQDPIEKAKIVYKYVQDHTRYISVQEGIGGIQPIEAARVDEVKYGDCKGLSNYTKALLDIVGVESYYTRVYASGDLVDINEDFVTFIGQTNHVIIYLPNEESDIWLECTSQTSPFGYNANFTDDRDVFVIKPQGGEIIHTTAYKTEDNLQLTNAEINLSADGEITGDVTIKTLGYQYALHEGIQNKPLRDQELYFKEYWDYINNLSVKNINFDNDKDNIVFTESVEVSSPNFVTKSGKRLLFQPNTFNRISSIPTRYTNRTLDFEIERGYKDVDEFVIKLDPEIKVEAMPKPLEIVNKFGTYKFSIEQRSENELVYKRTHILNKGYYPKEEYNDFRDFMSTIVKHDKTKIVLTK